MHPSLPTHLCALRSITVGLVSFLCAAVLIFVPATRAAQTIVANYSGASLYILDLTSGDRTVLSSGTVGTGPALDRPVSLVLDASRNLYVGSETQLVKVDVATGNRTLIPNPGSVLYRGIYGLALDSQGNLIAGSGVDSAIYRIDVTTGVRTTLASSSIGSGTAVGGAGGVLVDTDGSILYTDFRNSSVWRLVRLNATTLVRTDVSYPNFVPQVGTGPATGQSGTVVKLADNTFAISNYNGAATQWITRVDPTTGNRTILTGNATGTGAAIGTTFALSSASDGTLYASDFTNNAVLRVDPATGNRTVLSQLGTAGTGPAFNRPLGILPVTVASVTQPDAAPSIEPATFSGARNQPFTFFIRASNNPTSYGATGLPAGLTVDSATGWITGTPTVGGAFVATLSATNASGTGTTPLYLTITPSSQTLTFDTLSDKLTTDASFTLSASADSGLAVTYTIVSGPAMLSGSTVTLTGASGWVVVRASQPGNPSYSTAADVTRQFFVQPVGPQIYFGQTVATLPASSTAQALVALPPLNIAASIAPDNSTGTIIGFISDAGQGFVFNFTPAADGSFAGTAQVYRGNLVPTVVTGPVISSVSDVRAVSSPEGPLAVSTFTIHGSVVNGALTATIVESNQAFVASMQPQSGPAAALAGYYIAPSLNTASGAHHFIVAADGAILALDLSPAWVAFGGGTIAPTGAFTVSSTLTVSGAIDPATTIVRGTAAGGPAGTVSFAGIKSSTLRTDRLVNLSSRAQSGPGERVLITGFVVSGTTPKRVLLRGVGPALAPLGVTAPLANPRLKLFNSAGSLLAENEDWTDAAVATAASMTGAFTLPAGSKDAALIATLVPGAYSVHVADASGATGVALAEIYDASENPQADYQRLANISSRGQVGTGENVLFAGFVVTGNAPKRVLLRGVGPALAALGIAGPLADPMVQLYQNGQVIARNDNWSGLVGSPEAVIVGQSLGNAETIAEAAAVTGAFPLPVGSRDSALIITLAPGAYSAAVSGVGGASGVALIEVYEIP